jgi:hypothetical protein
MTPALAQATSRLVCAWRGRIDEAACEAYFLESREIFDGETCLYTCCSAALVDGDDIGRSDRRGLSLGAGRTPGYVYPGGGSMRGGARRGRGELLQTAMPARLAYDPKGGGGRAGVRCCSLAYTGAM